MTCPIELSCTDPNHIPEAPAMTETPLYPLSEFTPEEAAKVAEFEAAPTLPEVLREQLAAAPPSHYGHDVWEDEDGVAYYLHGHVARRRAIAAANRYARTECGLRNLFDEEPPVSGLPMVRHLWFKPDPDSFDEEYWLPCEATDDAAQPYTEVSL